MLVIGESVCHCVHGLGVVESVEEKHIQGQVTRFSVVNFQGLTVMVNLERASGVLRPPITVSEAEKVLEYLGQPLPTTQVVGNPTQIHQGHLQSLRSGDIYRVCDIVRILASSARDKKLTPQQQEMLRDARSRLVQELAHVRNQDAAPLEKEIEQRLALCS